MATTVRNGQVVTTIRLRRETARPYRAPVEDRYRYVIPPRRPATSRVSKPKFGEGALVAWVDGFDHTHVARVQAPGMAFCTVVDPSGVVQEIYTHRVRRARLCERRLWRKRVKAT